MEQIVKTKKKILRGRNITIYLGSLMAIILLAMTDPNGGMLENLPFGAGIIATMVFLSKGFLVVSFLHLLRKTIFDYPSADFNRLLTEALKTPHGAGLAAIAMSVMTLAFAIIIYIGVAHL